jgi:uncharacterized protein YqjF (DUF2071 family)
MSKPPHVRSFMTATAEPALAERIATARRPPGRPVMHQRWSHLLFVHWEVGAAALRGLLPPALNLDTFEGRAFLGLVPFTISEGRFHGLPPLPLLSHFHEVNLRTYVHVGGRGPGVWFFSLDAANRLAAHAARLWYKLPYHWAAIRMTPGAGARSPRSGDAAGRFSYASRRRGSRQAADCSLQYGPTGAVAPAVPGTLEYFLVERYVLYAWSRGRLSRAQVHHEPYPVQAATVEDLQETLSVAAGVSEKGNRLSPLYAREVTVDIFPPRSLA